MFGIKSRQKLARAEMAFREAMARHQEYLGKLNTALYERDEYLRSAILPLASATSSCASAMRHLPKLSD